MTDAAQLSPDTKTSYAFMHEGVILSVPAIMQPRDLIKAIKELERMALEDYLRRTADCGGT